MTKDEVTKELEFVTFPPLSIVILFTVVFVSIFSKPPFVTLITLEADNGKAVAFCTDDIVVTGSSQVNPVLVAVPPEVVTLTLPDEPLPIIAVIVVAFTTVNEVAGVPPKLTSVVPVKFVPVILTVVPAPEEDGVNEAIVGIFGS